MAVGRYSDLAKSYHTGSGLQELRTEAIPVVAILALGAAYALSAYIVAWLSIRMTVELWLPVAILVFAGAGAVGSSLDSSLRGPLLVTGLTLAQVTALFVYPPDLAPWSGCLVVSAAGVVLGSGGALAALAVLSAALVGAVYSERFPLDVAIVSLCLNCTATALTWLALRPVYTALDWAWNSYVEALEKTERLRDRQGELAQALKQLNQAYYRLEQVSLELDRARVAADNARELKARLAATLSHELRAPLNLIIGFSQMMATSPETYDGEELPAAYRDDLYVIYRNACHLADLVDDVLDLSQIDASRMSLQREKVALWRVVDDAVTSIGALFADRGLALSVEVPASLPLLSVDPTRLRQVLTNLLKNALRFTEKGGVRVTATPRENDVVVAVADSGVGIAPEDLPRLFQEFGQLGGAESRRLGGSGLGLAISKRIVELHGGSMWAESEPGKGSTFYLSLPLASSVAAQTIRPEWETWAHLQSSGSTDAPTVAVVGRDQEVARLFRRYLDDYEVVGVGSLEQAKQLAESRRLNALVVATAPGRDAWDQARQASDSLGGLPAFVCALHTVRSAGQELGALDYLSKPVRPDRLRAVLAGIGRGVRTVLVVDDDPEALRLLKKMVRSASRRYQVRTARNGAEALQLMQSQRPDLVLLDLMMPDLDGYELLARMRAAEELRSIPVVIVSAVDRGDEVVVADLLGVTRRGGLPVREVIGCLKSSLDVLRSSPSVGSGPALTAAPGASPV